MPDQGKEQVEHKVELRGYIGIKCSYMMHDMKMMKT